jgi:hypothetical protein
MQKSTIFSLLVIASSCGKHEDYESCIDREEITNYCTARSMSENGITEYQAALQCKIKYSYEGCFYIKDYED